MLSDVERQLGHSIFLTPEFEPPLLISHQKISKVIARARSIVERLKGLKAAQVLYEIEFAIIRLERECLDNLALHFPLNMVVDDTSLKFKGPFIIEEVVKSGAIEHSSPVVVGFIIKIRNFLTNISLEVKLPFGFADEIVP